MYGELVSVTSAQKLADASQVKDKSWSETTGGEAVETAQSAINAWLRDSVEAAASGASGLALKFDASSKKLQLGVLEGSTFTKQSEIDASEFVKDGMLEGAAFIEKATAASQSVTVNGQSYTASGLTSGKTYIVFVWNTAAGKSVQPLDVSTLVDTYTAGDGLTLTDGQFSAVVDNTYELGHPHLALKNGALTLAGVETYVDAKVTEVDDKVADVSEQLDGLSDSYSEVNKKVGTLYRKTVNSGESSVALFAGIGQGLDNPPTQENSNYIVERGSIAAYYLLHEIVVDVAQMAGSPVTVSWSGITPSTTSPLIIEYRVVPADQS